MTVIGHGYDDNVGAPAFRNVIINGAMQVAQRATSVSGVIGTGYTTADRWNNSINALGTWTNSVENDGPTESGFSKSWKWLCTTADASPAASDYCVMEHRIEGQNLQHFAKGTTSAKKFALSFWVKANVTGTYIVEIRDNTNSRHICKAYTITSSGVWEKKTLIFDADTIGAFANDNTAALTIEWWLSSGSTFNSGVLATAWAATNNANRAVGQVNVAAATNNYWQITGVQLEAGSVATPFEFEPYETTLRKCQRYYFRINGPNGPICSGAQWSATGAYGVLQYPVWLRANPTTLASSSGTDYFYFDRNGGSDFFNSFVIGSSNQYCARLDATSNISGTAGNAGWFHFNSANAYIEIGAEL